MFLRLSNSCQKRLHSPPGGNKAHILRLNNLFLDTRSVWECLSVGNYKCSKSILVSACFCLSIWCAMVAKKWFSQRAKGSFLTSPLIWTAKTKLVTVDSIIEVIWVIIYDNIHVFVLLKVFFVEISFHENDWSIKNRVSSGKFWDQFRNVFFPSDRRYIYISG